MRARQRPDEHPFKTWIRKRGLSYEDVAGMCKNRGEDRSADYIKQICNRHARPGIGLCLVLEAITQGEIDHLVFWGVKLRPKKAA